MEAVGLAAPPGVAAKASCPRFPEKHGSELKLYLTNVGGSPMTLAQVRIHARTF
jgi:hypothetical protein